MQKENVMDFLLGIAISTALSTLIMPIVPRSVLVGDMPLLSVNAIVFILLGLYFWNWKRYVSFGIVFTITIFILADFI